MNGTKRFTNLEILGPLSLSSFFRISKFVIGLLGRIGLSDIYVEGAGDYYFYYTILLCET